MASFQRQNRTYGGTGYTPPYPPEGAHLGYLFLHRVTRTLSTDHIHLKGKHHGRKQQAIDGQAATVLH